MTPCPASCALHDRFANHTIGLFTKHGIDNVAYWVDDVGHEHRLIYMLGYPDLGPVRRAGRPSKRTQPGSKHG